VRIRVLTTAGVKDLEIDSPATRSAVGSHWNAVQAFLATGETEPLEPYKTIGINDYRMMTDPDEIERLARIGDLDIDDIYEDPDGQ
jgi:hypothetical protein